MCLDFFGYGRGRGDERLGFDRDRRDEKDVYDGMNITLRTKTQHLGCDLGGERGLSRGLAHDSRGPDTSWRLAVTKTSQATNE